MTERVPFSPATDGNWEIVMMLREWAGQAGYVTRDFARVDSRYIVVGGERGERYEYSGGDSTAE